MIINTENILFYKLFYTYAIKIYMRSKTKMRIVAVIICVIVYAMYIAITTVAGWSHGGGLLVIAILVSIMRTIWKAARDGG